MSFKLLKWIHNPWRALVSIFALTFLAYSNIFHNGFFMDDLDYIVNWPLIESWDNIAQFFIGYTPPAGQEGIFSPLKTLVHAINFHLYGREPFGHHVYAFVNYLMGISFVYLLGQFFLKNRTLTFICTLLFALHPIHIEYVSSITGSVDALGVNLLFLSFYFYVRAQKDGLVVCRNHYIWSLIFAFAAIYLHELCITLPIMFLWYDICFSLSKKSYKSICIRVTPLFLFSISYVIAKFLSFGSITRGRYLYDSFYLTMLVTIKAWAKYVYIMFVPYKLTFNHVISKGIFSYDQEDFDRASVLSQSIFDGQVIIALLVVGCIAFFAFKNYKKEPLITFCIGWFFIGLLPGANIVPSSVYFAERYLYPGSLGFCLLFAWYINKMIQSNKNFFGIKLPVISGILIVLIVGYCIPRIWIRNLDWRNEMTIYQSAVRENSQSALMRTDLGLMYLRNNKPNQAIESLKDAIKIRPKDEVSYVLMSDAYLELNQEGEAIKILKEAIVVAPQQPNAYYNLGRLYDTLGNSIKAQEYIRKAIFYFREQGFLEEAQYIENIFVQQFGVR